LAEWGDYLGIHTADGNEPFGQEALQEIAAIAGVADDIDAVEQLRAALVPMGRAYRRIIAMVPSELKGAPGQESHSERLEWLDTQILNPLKRLLPALAEDRRYMFSMWPQEVRPHDLPDWICWSATSDFSKTSRGTPPWPSRFIAITNYLWGRC